ncbi:carboxylate-amine ligase [Methanonatronarchaeum sp. AMET6-2]|uniref:carboxylate-amine ligase n=1 Tax=Methanonatronarchaeum sp. AMET6-2 TaxID=2933293 RepID=UPI001221F5A4|nr:carboxylate-amine ligase [Methanonatronarchaeum sp. AMET6-2]RZN63413.1 MAG: carboxylate-amine ligase [Methanonatronarchaeia archaeon]UOY10080.1 carboxylate-amine ligase [Methanonatronarchaeum sp. AMET6-2]
MTKFGESEPYSIGIEEEFQIVDPETWGLVSRADEMLERAEPIRDNLRTELFQSILEIATDVCHDIDEARENICRLRNKLSRFSREKGYRLAASGTHPFAQWKDQDVTDQDRYREVLEDLRWTGKRELIFGQHVHVGVQSKEEAIYITNTIKNFLPHLLALSTNSPFWQSEDTGLKSTRIRIFDSLPRTGLPTHFRGWSHYKEVEKRFIKGGSIDDVTMIWWDVRPRADLGTVEIRIADLPTKVDESIALAALTQALVYKLSLAYRNPGVEIPYQLDQEIIKENRWRALRDGLHGKFIKRKNGEVYEIPVQEEIKRMLEFTREATQELGLEKEIKTIRKIAREKYTGADRQLDTYRETQDLKQVVRQTSELTEP